MLALDHRGSVEKMLPAGVPRADTIIDIKRMLISALSPYYSGVLLDSDYGLKAYKQSKHSNKPYLLCIEKTGYTDTDHERITNLEHSVKELKDKGAKGVKILLFFHPDAKTASDQIALTRKVNEDCKANELPFFLEILNYPLNEMRYDPSDLLPRSVKIFLDEHIRADVFKLEFPGNAKACQEVTGLLGDTPWILLTKGETFEKFKAGLTIAAQNGARGFLAGRSLWQDFTRLPQEKWEEFIQTTVQNRFLTISQIVSAP